MTSNVDKRGRKNNPSNDETIIVLGGFGSQGENKKRNKGKLKTVTTGNYCANNGHDENNEHSLV